MHFSGLSIRDVASIQLEARDFRAKEPYGNFAQLRAAEQEGTAFRRSIVSKNSRIAIVAPHGGNLELGSSEVAALIAGTEHSLYSFESLKPHGDNSLRITSARFDDPECLALCGSAETVISVHGCFGAYKAAFIGGADESLRDLLIERISAAGINSGIDLIFEGLHPENICNKGKTGRGVQIEMTSGLRQELQLPFSESGLAVPAVFKLVEAVRSVLISRPRSEPDAAVRLMR